MKFELFGSRAGLLVGAPQISRLNRGSRMRGRRAHRRSDRVIEGLVPKLTASPSNVSGASGLHELNDLGVVVGSQIGGVALIMAGSGAGNVLPLICVYGSRPSSSRLSVCTEPSGHNCIMLRWKIWTWKPSSLNSRDTG